MYYNRQISSLGRLGQEDQLGSIFLLAGIGLVAYLFFQDSKASRSSSSVSSGRRRRKSHPVSYYQERSRKRKKRKLGILADKTEALSRKLASLS